RAGDVRRRRERARHQPGVRSPDRQRPVHGRQRRAGRLRDAARDAGGALMHARKQLRDEVVSLLTGLTSTGSRVFADRLQSRPLAIDELPALMVSTGAEAIEVGTIHVNGLVNRELDLDVAAVIRAASGLD